METNQIPNRAMDDEIEIDLMEVLHQILMELPVILLTAVAGALAAYIISKTVMMPKYTSSTKMYVLAREIDSDDNLTTGDLQAGSLLTKDYEQIIKSRQVTEVVIARLKLRVGDEVMKPEQLIKMLSVSTEDNTRVIQISVTDTDPYRACDIADSIREVAGEQIQAIMESKAIKVVDRANIPTSSVSPNVRRNVLIGGLLGFVLAAAFVIITYLGNDSIQTSDDIEKYLGLSTLGTIPLAQGEQKSRKRRKRTNAKGGARR